MCGIAGIIRFSGAPVSEHELKSATGLLQHRGPETPQVWISQNKQVGLGHCRLSIIDPEQRSSQPLSYLDRYQIVHNGELYNYLELRSILEKKGYQFHTKSDTEVIVAAYDEFKSDCLQHFDGMFAFAIWDAEEQALFCARDRFGEKPFFYFMDDKQFLFASEMKTLWAMGVEKEVNPRMLYNFLTIDYTTNPNDPSETFYSHIQKLPPASLLRITAANAEAAVEKYWQLYPEINHSITEEQAIDQFKSLLMLSISRRLRSDVAIGTSLSGGLDSSSIVAFCDQAGSAHYTHQCFTAHFPGYDKDESEHARGIAQQFGLKQQLVTIESQEIPELMIEVMQHQEEPFSSGSVLAQYKVYEAAAQAGVKVLLDGQGADEILGGYHKYYPWYWQELYRNNTLSKSGELQKAAAIGIHQPFGVKHKLAALVPQFAAAMLQSSKAKKAFRSSDLDPEFAFNNKHESFYSTPSTFDLNGALYFNTFTIGLEELLRLADRNSMAHAVEVRLPFLYHELVAFLFTLPAHFKIKDGWTKWLLRKATANILPQSIVWRKDKVGFEPPQQQWMQHDSVITAIQEGKEQLVKNNILQQAALNKKIKPHAAHAVDIREWKYWSASLLFK